MTSASVHKVDKTRIAQNTIFLYIRMIVIMFLGLYVVRIVLNTLGVVDYGIYNAVAGVVTLLSFLGSSMASATQRFFSYALGKQDLLLLRRTFSTNLIIYAIIGLLAVLLLESVGLWFLNERLKLPEGRLADANIVYQFAIFSLVAQIMMAPLIAVIIAHEDMQYFTLLSFVEVILKFLVATTLIFVACNKLIFYAVGGFVAASCITGGYAVLCYKKYAECHLPLAKYDKKILREIVDFTWWTLFGSLSTMLRGQAVTLLLNQMFSPAIVAAKVIALNVSGTASAFSNNFNVGLYPSIIKSYAADDRNSMYQLIFSGCKITFFLMWVLTCPLILRMEYVLTLWLKQLPDEVVIFTQLSLLEALILSVSMPLATAARAPGKMMGYELTLGLMQVAIFPLSWVVLKMGYPVYSVFLVAIIVNILMFFVRLIIVHFLIDLPILRFLQKVALPVCLVTVVSAVPAWLLDRICPSGFLGSLLTGIFSAFLSTVIMYFIGLDREQRRTVLSVVQRKVKRGCR